MKAFLATLFAFLCAFQAVGYGQKPVGTWQGKLKEDKDEMRLVLKIKDDAGKLTGELYSIDEDGDPIALSSVSSQGNTLTFAVAIAGIRFSGHFSEDGNSITGTWTEDKKPLPLTVFKATAGPPGRSRNLQRRWPAAPILRLRSQPSSPASQTRWATVTTSKAATSPPRAALDDLIGYA